MEALTSELGKLLGLLIVSVMVGVVSRVMKELEERKLIKEGREREIEDKIRRDSERVVAWVEAWAVREGKEGDEKLKRAVRRLSDRWGLDEEKAEEFVESALALLGEGIGKVVEEYEED